MTIADSQSPYPLNNIEQDGKLPKSRLDDANVAQQIYWNTHQANLGRNNYGAYLQGVCDGNPPYRQSALRSSGQGWRANFSTKESKARKNSGKTPYYDLFASGPTYAEIRTKVKGEITADDASGIITEEFHTMLEEWSGFEMNVWKMIDSFVGFGRGWLFWPQIDNWHFKAEFRVVAGHCCSAQTPLAEGLVATPTAQPDHPAIRHPDRERARHFRSSSNS